VIDLKTKKMEAPSAFDLLNKMSHKVSYAVHYKLFDLSIPDQRQELEQVLTMGVNSTEQNNLVFNANKNAGSLNGKKGVLVLNSGEGQFVTNGEESTYMVALMWFEWSVREKEGSDV
jgi:hypothetical protein